MDITLRKEISNQNSPCYRQLAFAGILGPIMFWLISIILGLSQPGYSSIKHTLSALVYTPYGWLQTFDFYLFGLLIILFTIGFYTGIKIRVGLKASLALMFLMGLGMLIIGIFPTDPGPEKSLQGLIHHQTVKALGVLFPISCLLMLPSLKGDPRWKRLANYTAISGLMVIILIVGWIIMTSSGLISSWIGLYERIFTGIMIIWLEVMAIRLWFLPDQLEKTEKEIGIILAKGLNVIFWKNLGESTIILFSRLGSRKPTPEHKPNFIEVSKYVVFGTILVMAVRNHYRNNKAITQDSPRTSLPLTGNDVLCWCAKRAGNRLGLSPVTNLALDIISEDNRPKQLKISR